MQPVWRLIRRHRDFLLYLAVGLFFRFWNFRNFLFFTWDQGRDAFVLERIVSGDPVLVGPTSGLAGFFLGPLWYYLGVPGYILTGGSPYGISLWYIFLTSLALPLFWLMSARLFRSRRLTLVCAYLLALIPGSISGTLKIWNPMLGLPLMTGAFLAFWKAREKAYWLWLGFFLLALTLQSEFAYAVFFIVPLFLLIPWIRQRWHPLDFLGSAAAIGITLLPQLAFELRNNWIMTSSLLKSLGDQSTSTSWSHLALYRPGELFWTTSQLFFGGWGKQALLLTPIVFGSLVLATWAVWRRQDKNRDLAFGWKLLTVLAVIPYPFFMVWRGNYGNFFDYYLTPHFIFLAPLVLRGLVEFRHGLPVKLAKTLSPPRDWAVLALGILFTAAVMHASWWILEKNNQAGLRRMDQAVDVIYTWSNIDQQTQPVVRVFTPNLQTEQYDYLFRWQARRSDRPVPLTVRTGRESQWYVLVEPDHQIPEKRFVPWYKEATAGGYLWRQKNVGVLTLETWGAEPPATASAGLEEP